MEIQIQQGHKDSRHVHGGKTQASYLVLSFVIVASSVCIELSDWGWNIFLFFYSILHTFKNYSPHPPYINIWVCSVSSWVDTYIFFFFFTYIFFLLSMGGYNYVRRKPPDVTHIVFRQSWASLANRLGITSNRWANINASKFNFYSTSLIPWEKFIRVLYSKNLYRTIVFLFKCNNFLVSFVCWQF